MTARETLDKLMKVKPHGLIQKRQAKKLVREYKKKAHEPNQLDYWKWVFFNKKLPGQGVSWHWW